MSQKSLFEYAGKPLKDCTRLELFNALLRRVDDAARERGYNQGKKKLYYISAEFLIGKLLSNNLLNLGLRDAVAAELAEAGIPLSELEEFELEPSLGNGGLGRLAACFLDSLATLGLPADGLGLAYHCGLFRQSFVDNRQAETPDTWLRWGTESWMHRTDVHYDIPVGEGTLRSTMYEIDVTGYGSKGGKLRLFDVDTADERLIKSGIAFDQKELARNLTLFLYPDDSTDAGRLLRVYQEYFMVANAARLILEECAARGSNLHDLADYAAIQINDTHPTLVIPELIRLLGEKGIGEDEAVEIVTAVCGYTNHTILAEALETWPAEALEQGREVFAVPGNADAPGCRGTNALLKEGATPVTCGWDVLEEFEGLFPGKLQDGGRESAPLVPKLNQEKPPEPPTAEKKDVDKENEGDYIDLREQLAGLSADELAVVTAIEKQSSHVDDIIAKTGLPTAAVLRVLTLLTIKKYVKRNPGNYYSLNITKK